MKLVQDYLYKTPEKFFNDNKLILCRAVFGCSSNVLSVNTTANRPATPATGQSFFDSTLNMPIWYNGTDWVDSTGTTV